MSLCAPQYMHLHTRTQTQVLVGPLEHFGKLRPKAELISCNDPKTTNNRSVFVLISLRYRERAPHTFLSVPPFSPSMQLLASCLALIETNF